MFDDVKSTRVNLGGSRAAHASGSRSEFLKRQKKEREVREHKRICEQAALRIQAKYRSHRLLILARNAQRQVFDKRCGDIAKVEAVLPADAKAKFIFKALVPMMRQFAFFFSANHNGDSERLSRLLRFILFSAQLPTACNFFHLAVAAEEETRRSALALSEKFLTALVRVGEKAHLVSFLKALGTALCPAANSGLITSIDAQLAAAAIGQLLRRTPVLSFLTAGPLLQQPPDAAELVTLVASGFSGCSRYPEEQQRLSLVLFSAPMLCTTLVKSSALKALDELIVALPATAPSKGEYSSLLAKEIQGKCQGLWLLDNLVGIMEERLLKVEIKVERLGTWLRWIAWLQASCQTLNVGATQWSQTLQKPSLVRSLIQALDGQGPTAFVPLLRLLFNEGTPSSETMNVIAFATPLSERLFLELVQIVQRTSAQTFYSNLDPPSFTTDAAIQLHALCATYTLQLSAMYDSEFDSANPLQKCHRHDVALFLNQVAYLLVTGTPKKSTLSASAKALRLSVVGVVRALYARHIRHPVLSKGSSWIVAECRTLLSQSQVVSLGDEDYGRDEEDDGANLAGLGNADAMDVDSPHASAWASQGMDLASQGMDLADTEALQAVLDEIPHILPFDDRIALLHRVILADQERRALTRGPWGQNDSQLHQVRRDFLLEDSFAAFQGLNNEEALRDTFRIEFIASDGSVESGIDGGGLFKEFMIHVCREVFDPDFGLFRATSDQTLYPAPNSIEVHPQALELFRFVGKVTGKAIYEMALLEPQFSRVFLNRMLGRVNEVDDLAALDQELHRNIFLLKASDAVEEMGLTFSVSTDSAGHVEEVDLIPDGRNVPVTNENKLRYIYHLANFRMNTQLQRQTNAFVSGLKCVIPVSWIRMFNPFELNMLISGNVSGFDVEDLRQHTVYSGGYNEESPVVQWLWALLQHKLESEDLARFLMFFTSCSRAPLLGFKNLYPKFCIHRVPDNDRLPTASTCANLLKLPDYTNPELLETKLLQAIRAEAGFDLS